MENKVCVHLKDCEMFAEVILLTPTYFSSGLAAQLFQRQLCVEDSSAITDAPG